MFKIKDKDGEDQIHELELVYDSDSDIDIELKIDGKMLMCFFRDGVVTLQENTLQHFSMELINWEPI